MRSNEELFVLITRFKMSSKAPVVASPMKLKLQKSDLSMSVQSAADVADVSSQQNQPLSDSPQQEVGYCCIERELILNAAVLLCVMFMIVYTSRSFIP